MPDIATLEIIGFDETVDVPCGRSKVLVWDSVANVCFFFPPGTKETSSFLKMDLEEVLQCEREGRLTFFIEGGTFPKSAVTLPYFRDAVALFARTDFQKEFNIKTLSGLSPGEDIHWVQRNMRDTTFALTYVTQDVSERIMDAWAIFMDQAARAHLALFYGGRNKVQSLKKAEKAADFGFFAATGKSTRHSLYLTQGVIYLNSNSPQRIINLHSLVVSEQEGLSLAEFIKMIQNCDYVLRAQLSGERSHAVDLGNYSSEGNKSIQQTTQDTLIAEVKDRVDRIVARQDAGIDEIVRDAIKFATDYPRLPKSTEARVIDEILRKHAEDGDRVPIDYTAIRVIASQPAAYCPGVLVFGKITQLDLLKLAEVQDSFGDRLGEVATAIYERMEKAAII